MSLRLRRVRLAAPLALAIAALAGSDSIAAVASIERGKGPVGPSRMLVTASEFRYVLSRATIAPGPALIEMYNRGEDPHNLRIKRLGRKRVWRIPRTEPGESGELELRLRRGRRYLLWCSLPAHRERGMDAELRARRKR